MIPLWSRQPFGPGNLFASGEQGAWYDPSDINLAWQRNLLTRSEEFDNAAWTKDSSTISANSTTAPDGTATADKIVSAAATAATGVSQSITANPAAYTASYYVKAAEATFVQLLWTTARSTNFANFDLTNGTITAGTYADATITAVGSGWYRLTITSTLSAGATSTFLWLINNGAAARAATYSGNGTNGVFVWGAQLELGSAASAYQRITDGVADYANNVAQPVMYQDSTGATLVSAVEQPVGLILDKSRGVVIGSELVTNGDFSNGATGWTLGTGWSVSGGIATTVAATAGSLTQPITVTAGRAYLITFDISNWSANTVLAQFLGGTVVSGATSAAANGRYSTIIFAVSGNNTLSISKTSSAAALSVDNVSVKEIAGNHAFQATPASRPVLSARYNLLTYSEQFDNAVWTKQTATVTANATTAPDGTMTADALVYPATNETHASFQNANMTSGVSYTQSVYVKANGQTFFNVYGSTGFSSGGYVTFNLTTGAISSSNAFTGSIVSMGSGWYRCIVTATATSTVAGRLVLRGVPADTGAGTLYTGDGTSGIFIWGADLRVTNDALRIPAYQRIAAATDYDTTGFLPYLRFDGVDDSLATNSIDFTTATIGPRLNLLTYPQDFDNAYWSKLAGSITANTTTAPDGTTTADKLVEDSTLAAHRVISQTFTVSVASYVFSFYAKPAGRNYAYIRMNNGVDIIAGTVDLSSATVTQTLFGAISATAVGDGWVRVVGVAPTTSTLSTSVEIRAGNAAAYTNYTGDGSSGIFLWGAQLEVGSTASEYQPVGTDKMTVFAGVRKLSDAAQGVVTELSATIASNNGTFLLSAPNSAAANYNFSSKGTTQVDNTVTAYTAPNSAAITAQANIAGPSNVIRVNGAQAGSQSGSQGTGLYGNYPLFIGRRNNASLPFNGRLYNLIVRGAQTDASTITVTENYINAKTGAY